MGRNCRRSEQATVDAGAVCLGLVCIPTGGYIAFVSSAADNPLVNDITLHILHLPEAQSVFTLPLTSPLTEEKPEEAASSMLRGSLRAIIERDTLA